MIANIFIRQLYDIGKLSVLFLINLTEVLDMFENGLKLDKCSWYRIVTCMYPNTWCNSSMFFLYICITFFLKLLVFVRELKFAPILWMFSAKQMLHGTGNSLCVTENNKLNTGANCNASQSWWVSSVVLGSKSYTMIHNTVEQ